MSKYSDRYNVHINYQCKYAIRCSSQITQAEVAIAPYRLSCNLVIGICDRLMMRSSSKTASLFNILTFSFGCAGLADVVADPELLLAATAIDIDLVLVIGVNALVDGVSIGCDVIEAMRKRRSGVLSPVEFVDRIVGTVARGLLGTTGSIVGGLLGTAALHGGQVAVLVCATAASSVGWSVGWIIGRLIHRHWRSLVHRAKVLLEGK